jgi:hypothetical protein
MPSGASPRETKANAARTSLAGVILSITDDYTSRVLKRGLTQFACRHLRRIGYGQAVATEGLGERNVWADRQIDPAIDGHNENKLVFYEIETTFRLYEPALL